MRKSAAWITFLLVIFLIIPSHAISDTRGVKVIKDLNHQSGNLGAYQALIIGINNYQDDKIPDLKTAVNDAQAMSELLSKKYGFTVTLLLDQKATKKAIYQALRGLALSTKPDDSILIYYAGHGDLDRAFNDGWWIPVDATAGDPVTYLDNIQVQKAMSSMQARHVLLIADSCYSGTLFGQTRAMPPVIDDKYYLNLYNDKSRWGMTSGNKTPVSDSGTSGHSVFAYQLLKELKRNKKPYISTQEIYTRIAPIVSNNSEQTPLCRPIRNTGDQGGEFVFIASRGAISQNMAPAKPGKTPSAQTKTGAPEGPSGYKTKETARDGTLIAYASGVVFDQQTGLEWIAGPDRDTSWNDAKRWTENLKAAGGGWRMPTLAELETLYQKGVGTHNRTPLLKTTGWGAWSGETRRSSLALGFTFVNGRDGWLDRHRTYVMRGFAVRSRRQ